MTARATLPTPAPARRGSPRPGTELVAEATAGPAEFADLADRSGGPNPVERPGGADARTRDRVLAHVLEHGPVTAAALADLLDLTSAAVRRHLDGLADDGDITTASAPASATGARGRGRPARAYVVTPRGHRRLESDYASVATAALRYLAERVGPEAVADFARQRFAGLEDRYRGVVDAAGPEVGDRAAALAAALAADGFAASTRPVGAHSRPGGVQLCQGHCPLHRVATEFPQFCEAETDAFARLLGVHVQRLATLAGGEHVCTTFVPHVGVGPPPDAPDAPPAPHDLERRNERTPR